MKTVNELREQVSINREIRSKLNETETLLSNSQQLLNKERINYDNLTRSFNVSY